MKRENKTVKHFNKAVYVHTLLTIDKDFSSNRSFIGYSMFFTDLCKLQYNFNFEYCFNLDYPFPASDTGLWIF